MISDRRLPVFAAVLVERGRGTLETEQAGLQAVEAPCLFWLLPEMLHSYGPLPGTGWDERWVLFSGPVALDFVEAGLVRGAAPLVTLADSGEVAALMSAIHSRMALRSARGDAVASALMHHLVVCDSVQSARRRSNREADADEMIRDLRDHACEPIDLSAFARRFAVSPATLRRRFIAAVGMPPKVYQLNLRVDRAKELLAATDLPIAAVSERVGFDDSFYFARLFVAREGCAPSEFRQRHRRR